MEEVVSLWMEGGLCHGTEEEALGRKVYRVLEKLYFDFLFFFINIMLMWKIVGVSKVSVLYIYIYRLIHLAN